MLIQPKYLSLSDLLEKRLFRIPEYQRAYSWGAKQRGDMLADIHALRDTPDRRHFMATIVCLQKERRTIVTDEYSVIEVVDGQQRLTTLVIMLKAIEKALNRDLTEQLRLAAEIGELLIKQDDVSLILLQTNHDQSEFFINYIRNGDAAAPSTATTIADREMLGAIKGL